MILYFEVFCILIGVGAYEVKCMITRRALATAYSYSKQVKHSLFLVNERKII